MSHIHECFWVSAVLHQTSLSHLWFQPDKIWEGIRCRCIFVQEFNRGLFDYLIATDDVSVARKRPAAEDADDVDDAAEASTAAAGKQKSSRKRRKPEDRDGEFGVTRCGCICEEFVHAFVKSLCVWCSSHISACSSHALCGERRGIDFKGVRTVVNVHPPPDVKTYVHRVGRTGRAGQSGTAVSLLSPGDATLAKQLEDALSGTHP